MIRAIRGLDCWDSLEDMIRSGSTVSDVVRAIRDEGLLPEYADNTLITALCGIREHIDVEDRKVHPGTVVHAKSAFRRLEGGVDECVELEYLYVAQKERVRRMLDLETKTEGFMPRLGDEIETAAGLIERRAKLRMGFNLVGQATTRVDQNEAKAKFGSQVAAVLARPDASRRILSLLSKIQRPALAEAVVEIAADEK